MIHRLGPHDILKLRYGPTPGKKRKVQVSVDAEARVDAYVLTGNGMDAMDNAEDAVETYRASRNKKAHELSFSPRARDKWGVLIVNRTATEIAVGCDVRW